MEETEEVMVPTRLHSVKVEVETRIAEAYLMLEKHTKAVHFKVVLVNTMDQVEEVDILEEVVA